MISSFPNSIWERFLFLAKFNFALMEDRQRGCLSNRVPKWSLGTRKGSPDEV